MSAARLLRQEAAAAKHVDSGLTDGLGSQTNGITSASLLAASQDEDLVF
jgi:hypothetical protein